MPVVRCPRCGNVCDAGVPRCPSCGGYLGVRRKEAWKPVEPEPEVEQPATLRPLLWLLGMFPGVLQPKVLVMSLIALPVAAGLLWLSAAMVAFGVVFSGMAIGGFAMVVYWTAVAWAMHGELCMPAEALADFDGTKWIVFLLVGLGPVSLLLCLIGLVKAG